MTGVSYHQDGQVVHRRQRDHRRRVGRDAHHLDQDEFPVLVVPQGECYLRRNHRHPETVAANLSENRSPLHRELFHQYLDESPASLKVGRVVLSQYLCSYQSLVGCFRQDEIVRVDWDSCPADLFRAACQVLADYQAKADRLADD
jgi:hypothetical protein